MKIFSYVLKTESGDYIHNLLVNKDYVDAVDFMKNEVDWEYDEWKCEGYRDSDIPYAYFDKQMIEI